MRLTSSGKAAQKRELPEARFDPPIRPRRPAGVFDNRHPPRICRMWREGGVDRTFLRPRPAADEGEVLLLDGVVLELVGKVLLRRAIQREEQHAGRVLIEAMNDADARIGITGSGQV